jgi:hypothetical protein
MASDTDRDLGRLLTTTLIVVGLTAGRTYTCSVMATNARGTGLTSAASGAVTA